MNSFNVSRSVYLETDPSGVGLGAGLLQVREGINYGYNKVQDNATPCPMLSLAKVYQVLNGAKALLIKKPLEYCIAYRSLTITVLLRSMCYH